MKLNTAKKVTDILVGCTIAALILQLFLPRGGKVLTTWVLGALLLVIGTVNLLWMRCPHCGGQLTRWGNKFCRSCGHKLEEN